MEVHEPAEAYNKRQYQAEEYLEMETASQVKHEFYQGEIFAMAGASAVHNIIFKNTFGNLFISLKNSKCQPFGSDLRLHIPENTLYTYPDISVYCGDIFSSVDDAQSATLPTVIIEILSPETRNYDRGQKFLLYRAIKSLGDYLLIDSTSYHVEHFSINADGFWQLQEYNFLQERFTIESIDVQLLLSDIYQDVLFA